MYQPRIRVMEFSLHMPGAESDTFDGARAGSRTSISSKILRISTFSLLRRSGVLLAKNLSHKP